MSQDRDRIDQDQAITTKEELANTHRTGGVSRRLFLKTSGATAALGGVAALPAARAVAQDATPSSMPGMSMSATPSAGEGDYGVPGESNAPVSFFSMLEAQTVEALTARILPGTPDDPGAREAGVVYYIDRALGGANLGYDLKTYSQGPFLVTDVSGGSVESTSQNNIYEYVYVQGESVPRYGYQSVITPQDLYRRGVLAVNAYAMATYKKNVPDLTEAQQDEVVTALQNGKATGFDTPSPTDFFNQLRNDTIEGMFSDPMYGGNRGLVGWKLVGFPGAQRFYTGATMADQKYKVVPQSLGQMMAAEESGS